MDTNDSLWSAAREAPAFPPLLQDISVDVAIVGGGITGLTCAMLLADAGKSVALLEARTLGSGVSNRSTVHMTEILDTRYHAIESKFGREAARLVAESSRAAIEQAATLAAILDVDCGFVRRPGWLYTENAKDAAEIEREHEAARRAGLAAELVGEAPLPFPTKRALRVPEQAQLHIGRYLDGLARAAASKGALVYESSRVVAVEDGDPCLVHTELGSIVRARAVFCATHTPMNRLFLVTKIAAYRSYVVAYPHVSIPDGLFWDTDDPYHYLSAFTVDGVPYLVVGGEDHKTGTVADTSERFDRLSTWTRRRFDVPAEPKYRWSAQVEEPVDGLPFIGKNSLSENVFVATGFSGNGTTFGTLAAMIVRDLVTNRPNRFAELFTATRVKPLASLPAFATENVDFPIHLVTDRVARPDAKSIDDVAPGEGKIVRVRGERLAVYRDARGNLHAVTAVCTHLGCIVKFNAAERTWDCPCHGSRFDPDGAVLDGPATRALARRSLEPVRRQSGFVERTAEDDRRRREAE